jgi:uncharacterized protein (DUF1015 family)
VAEFRPLRALRYDPERVDGLATVVSPPYDVISPEAARRLHALSPHNVVRLILNQTADPYADAARTLEAWRAEGILVREPEPAFFFYSQAFELSCGGRQRRDGLIGIMRLERFDSGSVLPHERTLAAPKADRLRLLRACRTNLDPIFGLVARPGLSFRALAGVDGGVPDVELCDAAGLEHRIWPVRDPGAIARIGEAVRDQPVVIADGHHRYETALAFREEMRAAHPRAGRDAPFEFVLSYLANSAEPGLVVLPTHRLVSVAADEVRTALSTLEDVFELTPYRHAQRAAFVAAVERGDRIGCVLPDTLLLLSPRAAGADRLSAFSPVTRRLAVVLLHEIVMPRLPASAGDTLAFTHDEAEVFAAVARGRAGAAFLVGAPTAAEVRAVSLAGETLPQKSTYFHPKPLTGLVFHPLDP